MNIHPEPAPFTPPAVNGVLVYRVLSVLALFAAVLDPTWRLFAWAVVSLAFWAASEKWKDVEKIKRKVRDETTTELLKQQAADDKAGSDDLYKFIREQIGLAHEQALGRMSTYVKDASPTRNKP